VVGGPLRLPDPHWSTGAAPVTERFGLWCEAVDQANAAGHGGADEAVTRTSDHIAPGPEDVPSSISRSPAPQWSGRRVARRVWCVTTSYSSMATIRSRGSSAPTSRRSHSSCLDTCCTAVSWRTSTSTACGWLAMVGSARCHLRSVAERPPPPGGSSRPSRREKGPREHHRHRPTQWFLGPGVLLPCVQHPPRGSLRVVHHGRRARENETMLSPRRERRLGRACAVTGNSVHHYGAGEPAASTIGVSVLVTRIALRSGGRAHLHGHTARPAFLRGGGRPHLLTGPRPPARCV